MEMNEENEVGVVVKRCKLSLKGRRSVSRLSTAYSPEPLSASTVNNVSPCNLAIETIEQSDNETSTLPNIGNTCFMNSVLHVLRITPQFMPWLHRAALKASNKNHPSEISILHKIYRALSETDKHKSTSNAKVKEELELQLRLLMNLFANQNPQFTPGHQFDAHEFLCWLVTVLRGQPHGGKRTLKIAGDFVPFVLEGKAKNVVFCNECETVTSHEDTFWDIKMPLSCIYETEAADVRTNFNADTLLRGEDKYLCCLCHQLTEARHSIRILSLPAVLILHIPSKWQGPDKGPFQVIEELPCIKNDCDESCRDPRHLFRLYALLIHIGSTSQFGHYITLTRRPLENTITRGAKRYHTRSNQMIWEDCCGPHDLKPLDNEWLLCDDDKVVYVKSVSQYFKSVTSASSARPALLWYQRYQ